MQALQFVVVTGLSGAGKTQALHALEDLGFFCVDNLPPALMEPFADYLLDSRQPYDRIALVIDVRGGAFFGDLVQSLDVLKARGIAHRLIYLDADDEILLRRFEETRRRHPIASEGGLAESIRDERVMLAAIRDRADTIVNTTDLPPHLLKRILSGVLSDLVPSESMLVNVLSFGFKHGLPSECDLVFDVRFLRNPYHERSLRHLSGLDAEVREYVIRSENGTEFLDRLRSFLEFCLPNYAKEGKSYLTIGIGCTGGRHRSVMIGEEIASWVRSWNFPVTVRHRDLQHEIKPDQVPLIPAGPVTEGENR